MAFNSTQLAALEAAAAAGVLEARIGDKLVRYQSLPDLLAAIRQARVDVATTGGSAPVNRRYVEHGRGY